MPNINVRKKLESIASQIEQLHEHIIQYSGIPKKDAVFVDNMTTEICEISSRIAALARDVSGDTSATRLARDVRKALGFTSP